MWVMAALLSQTAPIVADDDIRVMGRRLQAVSVTLSRDAAGRLACGLSESSGSPSMDARLCKTAAKCAGKGNVAPDAMRTCIDARKPMILEEFAAAARAGKG